VPLTIKQETSFPRENPSNGNGASTKSVPQGSNQNESQDASVEGFPFRDVRDYLAEFEKRDMLIEVNRLMNKDTEIMPLVRWQFRGLNQSQRKDGFSTTSPTRADGSLTHRSR
jgi:hypothetical protein